MQTGPRTAEGKAASSMNAMSHGLTSQKVVLPGEDSAQFEHLRRALFLEHRPATPTETILVEEIAQAHWRLERVRRRQDQAFDTATLDTTLLSLLHRYATTYERTSSSRWQRSRNSSTTGSLQPRLRPNKLSFRKKTQPHLCRNRRRSLTPLPRISLRRSPPNLLNFSLREYRF